MEQKTTVVVDDSRVRSVYYNGTFFDTNVPREVTVSDALRISRLFKTVVTYPKMPYDSSHWKNNKIFGLSADVDKTSGFGNCSYNLIKYSRDAGFDVRWLGRALSTPELTTLGDSEILLDGAMVWHDQPRDSWLTSPFAKNIAIVPFETTKIPSSWVDKINYFSALFVPCKQNIQMMRDSGVKVPIELIHWGVDEEKFYPLERDNKIFTIGTMGALSYRKGTDILVEAFQKAFPPMYFPDVRLLCKTSYNVFPFMKKDKRIQVIQGQYDHDWMINEFAKKIDVFAFPTRGEGFGLTPLEMMATGVPAIVTGWSGPEEYMNEDVGWKIEYDMEEATNFTNEIYKEYCGQWAKPKIDHLVEILRHTYYNREDVLRKGKNAAECVKENWLWKDKIQMYLAALDKHL